MYHVFLIHSSVDRNLGCFHVLSITNRAAHWAACIFLNYILSGYIPKSGSPGSYDISIFGFLRNHHTIFLSGCINLQSHRQCGRVPFFPHAVCAVTLKLKCKVLMDSCKALHDSVAAHLSSLCL